MVEGGQGKATTKGRQILTKTKGGGGGNCDFNSAEKFQATSDCLHKRRHEESLFASLETCSPCLKMIFSCPNGWRDLSEEILRKLRRRANILILHRNMTPQNRCPRNVPLQTSIQSFFFGAMLRASLQLWQSLGCANNVIVRHRVKRRGQVP